VFVLLKISLEYCTFSKQAVELVGIFVMWLFTFIATTVNQNSDFLFYFRCILQGEIQSIIFCFDHFKLKPIFPYKVNLHRMLSFEISL